MWLLAWGLRWAQACSASMQGQQLLARSRGDPPPPPAARPAPPPPRAVQVPPGVSALLSASSSNPGGSLLSLLFGGGDGAQRSMGGAGAGSPFAAWMQASPLGSTIAAFLTGDGNPSNNAMAGLFGNMMGGMEGSGLGSGMAGMLGDLAGFGGGMGDIQKLMAEAMGGTGGGGLGEPSGLEAAFASLAEGFAAPPGGGTSGAAGEVAAAADAAGSPLAALQGLFGGDDMQAMMASFLSSPSPEDLEQAMLIGR